MESNVENNPELSPGICHIEDSDEESFMNEMRDSDKPELSAKEIMAGLLLALLFILCCISLSIFA